MALQPITLSKDKIIVQFGFIELRQDIPPLMLQTAKDRAYLEASKKILEGLLIYLHKQQKKPHVEGKKLFSTRTRLQKEKEPILPTRISIRLQEQALQGYKRVLDKDEFTTDESYDEPALKKKAVAFPEQFQPVVLDPAELLGIPLDQNPSKEELDFLKTFETL